MWNGNSWKRKSINKHLGGINGDDEFKERNLGDNWGKKFNGEKIMDKKNWEEINGTFK